MAADMTKILVLVNPSAGSVDDEGGGSDPTREEGPLRAAVEQLRKSGSVDVVVMESNDDLRAATADLDEKSVYAVAGGDGTLHRVLNVLKDRPRPYLLIPAGTGNDFAAGAGVPEDLEDAARLMSTASPRPFDLVDVDGILAMNAAHLGIGVSAAQAASGWKDSLGRLAYPAGAVSAFKDFQPSRVTAVLDGTTVIADEEISLLAICNGSTMGGGTVLCPDARPDDGVMNVVIMQASTPMSLAVTAADLLRGCHLDRDDVIHQRGERVDVTVHGCDAVSWNIDGELTDLPPDVRCQIRPGAWQLIA